MKRIWGGECGLSKEVARVIEIVEEADKALIGYPAAPHQVSYADIPASASQEASPTTSRGFRRARGGGGGGPRELVVILPWLFPEC